MDPNHVSRDNESTALSTAAGLGVAGVVAWLLKSGAKVDAKDEGGATALHEAVLKRQVGTAPPGL